MGNYRNESQIWGRKVFLFGKTPVHVLHLGQDERDYNVQRSYYEFSYKFYISLEKSLPMFIKNIVRLTSSDLIIDQIMKNIHSVSKPQQKQSGNMKPNVNNAKMPIVK